MQPLDYDTGNRATAWLATLPATAVAGVFDLVFLFTLCALALAARF